VVPRVLLSVAVFDDDCYDLCDEKLDVPCIQSKCQSIKNIGPTSGIFIKGTFLIHFFMIFPIDNIHTVEDIIICKEKQYNGLKKSQVCKCNYNIKNRIFYV
jgi:hypothetical protein